MTLTLQPNINLHTLNTVNQTYQPQLLFNDYKQGMKLSYEIIQQLNSCDSFQLSIAFISLSGLATLKQTLLDLQNKNISGKIITSTYLGFNEPKVFKELLKFNNLEIRIYDDMKKGGARENLSLKNIADLKIPKAPIEEQNKFAEFVKLVDKQKVKIQKSLEEMQQLQKSLMSNYF